MAPKRTQMQINSVVGRELLSRLNEIPDPTVSARRFVLENFDVIQQSGKSLSALYNFFIENGLAIGSFAYFRDTVGREKLRRKQIAQLAQNNKQ